MFQNRFLILLVIVLSICINLQAQYFDVNKAVEYAKKYCNADPHNREYHYYPDHPWYRPNCANFVSQCLIAGGLQLKADNPYNQGLNGTPLLDDKGSIPNTNNLNYYLTKVLPKERDAM